MNDNYDIEYISATVMLSWCLAQCEHVMNDNVQCERYSTVLDMF